jgi:hypothetical protein
MKVNLLYDYLTPYGYIPNGLNPNYLNPLVKITLLLTIQHLDEYENGVGAISVMDSNGVIFPVIGEKYTISDLYNGLIMKIIN